GRSTVWINSPGGDCIAAARIYNMLLNYKGHVTIKIDGIAASAASVIAMAGNKVIMSPVSMLMIHNPMTIAFGEKSDMKRAMAMLDEVKESILNAYEIKTGMERGKLATLMDNETWMNVHSAMELGFVDEMMESDCGNEEDTPIRTMMYKRAEATNSLLNKFSQPSNERKVEELYHRLELIKKHI
ncbi:MAG: Clp protease ClpP, partial [Eubacteriales bacterium]